MEKFCFLFLLLLAGTVSAQPFHCRYHPKPSLTVPDPELMSFKNCGTITEDNTPQFTQYHLDNIIYGGPHNLACIYVYNDESYRAWFYRNSRGAMIKTISVDNGCDYFVHGLARSVVDGQTRFFDQQLTVVLKTPYHHVSPFYDGLASTCYGGKKVMKGEYQFLEDATCAYITTSGDLATDFMPQDMLPGREELGIPCVDLCEW